MELLSEIPESVKRESSSMTISGSSLSSPTSLNSLSKSTSPLSSGLPASGFSESPVGLSSTVLLSAVDWHWFLHLVMFESHLVVQFL